MHTQQGQALLEMIVASAVLLVAASSLLWLQRWQEIKAQTQHHAGFAAFRYTHTHLLGPAATSHQPNYVAGLFSPLSHSIELHHHTNQSLKVWAPETVAHQDALLGPTERVQFRAQAHQLDAPQRRIAWWWGNKAPLPTLQLSSHTRIDVGLGAVSSSTQMIERLQLNSTLWRSAYHASATAFSQWAPLIKPVDHAWQRPQPNTEWLAPWRDSIPSFLP